MVKEQPQILVIDDNEDILFMLETMLKINGYSVTAKDNPNNIEAVIMEVQPQVILMDMLLSGTDGREMCKIIKRNHLLSDIPIIMISALPDAASSCINAGADLFLSKPFEMTDLFMIVEDALTLINK